MNLRPYQQLAVDSIESGWDTNSSQLLVLPTGTGKTVVFTHLVDRNAYGRTLILAHREELIWQAAAKVEVITGTKPSIEMANHHADEGFFRRSKVVVSSVQTQNASNRLLKFDPTQFSMVIIDEAHHAPAKSYRRIIDYYKKNNPDVKVLGVTATPDRADEKALGMIFDEVAYEYKIHDAITDGWLVPVKQRSVIVSSLDYSGIKTTAGDLNGKQLAAVMEYEKNLHGIATPTLEIIGDRKTLVFAASVAHAERLCEIFNRHKFGSSEWVCGKTHKDARRETLRRFAEGKTKILVNVGCFTEGFDEPTVEVIVLARPTKSRALFAQMVGRGTRTLPHIVDGLETPEERRNAIAASGKPCLEIVDFVGNSGRHKLIHTANLLGGVYSEEEIVRAKEVLANTDESKDVDEALQQAREELKELAEQIKKKEEKEQARRRGLRAKVKWKSRTSDPFADIGMKPVDRVSTWGQSNKPCSDRLIAGLKRFGVEGADAAMMSSSEGSALIGKLIERSKTGKATYKQAKLLRRFGYSPDITMEEASKIIDAVAVNGWKRPVNDHKIERF
jgi:superfamily II DNA or RNA helicase